MQPQEPMVAYASRCVLFGKVVTRWGLEVMMSFHEETSKVGMGSQPRINIPANNTKVLKQNCVWWIPKLQDTHIYHSGKPVCPPGLVVHPLHLFQQHVSTTPEGLIGPDRSDNGEKPFWIPGIYFFSAELLFTFFEISQQKSTPLLIDFTWRPRNQLWE